MRKTLYPFKVGTIGLALASLAACGGASGGASADTQVLTGTVGSNPGLVRALANTSCTADTVIATSIAASAVSAEVAEDCSFTLELATGESYVISFALNGEFVATLVFDSGTTGFTTSVLPVGTGGTIDLGTVTFTGSTAVPSDDPLAQIDNDDDGLSDLEDSDDDNDGLDDEDEIDCDLDGAIDDYDDSDCEDDVANSDTPRIFEIKPRNDPHPENGDDTVDLDKDVRVRVSCLIDELTLTADTFRIEADGDTTSCDFELSDSHSGQQQIIKCRHDDDPFEADAVYTITIDGLACSDSTPVTAVTSQFLTDAADDDDGDFEDDLDDDDEQEADDDDGSSDDSNDDDSNDDDANGSDDDDDDDDDSTDDDDDDGTPDQGSGDN